MENRTGWPMNDFRAPITSTKQLATSIQDARTAKGMTQTRLAKATGIPRPWISQLEQGHIANPSFTKILKLMDALEMKLSVSYTAESHASDDFESESPSSAATAPNRFDIKIAVEHQPQKMNEQLKEVLANLAAINPQISSTYSTVLERSRQVDQQAKELENVTGTSAKAKDREG